MQMEQPNQPLRPLLTTKLHIPQARRDLVPRQHLFERLHQGLSSKLTLISAPAGFGKTSLVSAWMATRNAQQALPLAAWVALDAGDNDPVRFWRYVITACQTFNAAIGHSALALLHTAQQPSWELVLTVLINDLAQLAGQGVLVLEDYHVITAPQIHEMVVFLLDHFPTTLRLIMTTRSDPPLPLARLRAQLDLNELRAIDLRSAGLRRRGGRDIPTTAMTRNLKTHSRAIARARGPAALASPDLGKFPTSSPGARARVQSRASGSSGSVKPALRRHVPVLTGPAWPCSPAGAACGVRH